MGTTLYFALNTASGKEQGTYPTAATNYANVTPTASVTTEGFMIPYKWRAVANLTMSTGTGTTPKISRFGRFFSAPFAEDYTYNHPLNSADAIQYFLADYESNLSANHCVQQCHIFVWRPSTGAVVGIVQPVQTLAPGTKEPTSASKVMSTLGSYFSPTAGSINILKGDILVFEPFSTYTKSSSTSYTVRFYYGGSTDITAENTTISSPASKVVFSVDLPLEMPIGAVTGNLKYKAVMGLRGAALVSSLLAKSVIKQVTLVDGSPLISRLKVQAKVTTQLTTKALLSASLKSISKLTAWRQQAHDLSISLHSNSRVAATFPDKAVGEALNLYYSGTGSADNPTLSIGGKKGLPLAGVSFSASTSAPGIEILSCHGLRDGASYLLRINATNRSISLVHVEGIYEYTVMAAPGVSVVVVGSKESGFIVVKVDTAAMTSSDISVSATFRPNTLFLDPSAGALADGEYVYRCLYLFNDTAQAVTSVVLDVSTDSADVIGIATEFGASDVSLGGFTQYRTPISTNHKALDPTGWGGIFFMESTPQIDSELSANSLPLIIAAAPTNQASDGDTIQIPMKIEDEHDSQNRLSGLVFGPSLSWGSIPPRRGVTFWVRKYTTPGPSSDNTFKALFTVSADI